MSVLPYAVRTGTAKTSHSTETDRSATFLMAVPTSQLMVAMIVFLDPWRGAESAMNKVGYKSLCDAVKERNDSGALDAKAMAIGLSRVTTRSPPPSILT